MKISWCKMEIGKNLLKYWFRPLTGMKICYNMDKELHTDVCCMEEKGTDTREGRIFRERELEKILRFGCYHCSHRRGHPADLFLYL